MARSGAGMAAGLFGWGARLGWRGSRWALTRPYHLAKLGSKEMVGASAFGISYWAGLVVWFTFGLLALYLAALARQVGWLTPVQWALSASGLLFWLSLLVYLRTRKVRTNARGRAMMRKIFDATQQTAERVERVEQAVQEASRSGPNVLGMLRSAGTDSERMTAELFAEQAAKAREWTGGDVPHRPDPVVPVPRPVKRFGEGIRKGWRKGGPR